MVARRRLLPVLATAVLAVPVASAHAQGAGDDQYQDPFGSSGSSKSKSTQTAQTTQSGSQPGLSQSPPVSPAPSSSSSGSSSSTPAPAAAAPAPAASSLPTTGMELPGVALFGLGLLVSGVGLRLRTADETLY